MVGKRVHKQRQHKVPPQEQRNHKLHRKSTLTGHNQHTENVSFQIANKTINMQRMAQTYKGTHRKRNTITKSVQTDTPQQTRTQT